MGLGYTIDHEKRLVRTRGSGVLQAKDIEEFYRRLLADKAFDSTYRCLADLREVTEVAVTTDDLARSASLAVFAPGTRRALVAIPDAVFGMLRVYASFGERAGQTMRIFRRVAIAEAWIEDGDDRRWHDD